MPDTTMPYCWRPCCANTAKCWPCCSCRHTARNWLLSSGFGNWRGVWLHTTGSSPPWTNCSAQSNRVSTGGKNRMRCCADYAALFKTLCLGSSIRRNRVRVSTAAETEGSGLGSGRVAGLVAAPAPDRDAVTQKHDTDDRQLGHQRLCGREHTQHG